MIFLSKLPIRLTLMGRSPGLSSASSVVPPGLIVAIARSPTLGLSTSNLLPFPLASPKQEDAGYRDSSLGNDDGKEDSGGTKALVQSEPPGQRNLQYPEAKE